MRSQFGSSPAEYGIEEGTACRISSPRPWQRPPFARRCFAPSRVVAVRESLSPPGSAAAEARTQETSTQPRPTQMGGRSERGPRHLNVNGESHALQLGFRASSPGCAARRIWVDGHQEGVAITDNAAPAPSDRRPPREFLPTLGDRGARPGIYNHEGRRSRDQYIDTAAFIQHDAFQCG